MKTIWRPSFLAFFLSPASASASTARSSLRPAPAPVRWAVGNSIPVAAESARHGRRGSGPCTLSRSGGRPAPMSTDRSRSPKLAALASGCVRCAAGLLGADALCVLPVRPTSAPALRLPPVAAPSDRRIVDEPRPDGPLPPGVRPDAIVRPQLLRCQSLQRRTLGNEFADAATGVLIARYMPF